MRTSFLAHLALAAVGARAQAADLLFPYNMTEVEYQQVSALGLTAHVCESETEWYGLSTTDFESYKAIIIPDPYCGAVSSIQFLEDTKETWSAAITGNIVLIGTDPSYHAKSHSGAIDLIRDTIRFVASGSKGTGLYFSLSCYYGSVDNATVSSLSEFGQFTVRGNLSCYNTAHLVAKASALTTITDESLSNWTCSVHEAFSQYPTTGNHSFSPLAIAENATGLGEQTFADGSSGIPYIIARGVTPLGCGDNKTQADAGEECDDGDLNGTPGDLCDSICKCVYGVLSPGVCLPASANSSNSSTTTSISSSRFPLSTLTSWANSSSLLPVLPANGTTIMSSTNSVQPVTIPTITSVVTITAMPLPSLNTTVIVPPSNATILETSTLTPAPPNPLTIATVLPPASLLSFTSSSSQGGSPVTPLVPPSMTSSLSSVVSSLPSPGNVTATLPATPLVPPASPGGDTSTTVGSAVLPSSSFTVITIFPSPPATGTLLPNNSIFVTSVFSSVVPPRLSSSISRAVIPSSLPNITLSSTVTVLLSTISSLPLVNASAASSSVPGVTASNSIVGPSILGTPPGSGTLPLPSEPGTETVTPPAASVTAAPRSSGSTGANTTSIGSVLGSQQSGSQLGANSSTSAAASGRLNSTQTATIPESGGSTFLTEFSSTVATPTGMSNLSLTLPRGSSTEVTSISIPASLGTLSPGGTISSAVVSVSVASLTIVSTLNSSFSASSTSLPGVPASATSEQSTATVSAETSGLSSPCHEQPSSSASSSLLPYPETATSAGSIIASSVSSTSPPVASEECPAYVGVAVIYLIDIKETCPDGATTTETVTQILSTVTRSICQTSTSSFPCYPCVIGTPTPGSIATVTVTSILSSTDLVQTITLQPCETCDSTTITTAAPEHTLGRPCHGCEVASGSTPTLPVFTEPSSPVETAPPPVSSLSFMSSGAYPKGPITPTSSQPSPCPGGQYCTKTQLSSSSSSSSTSPSSTLRPMATSGGPPRALIETVLGVLVGIICLWNT